LMAVADPGEAVFVPAIRPRPGMVVREVVPRSAPRAVILADAAPCAFAQVRPPTLPVLRAPEVFLEADLFCRSVHSQAFTFKVRPFGPDTRGPAARGGPARTHALRSDDALARVIPSPEARAALEVHAAQPPVNAARRHPVAFAGDHRSAGVGQGDR